MDIKKQTATAKGFTLVELIVVIVILAILATIAFLSFSSQSASARDSKRKTDLSNIASKINIGAANGSKLTDFVTGTSRALSSGNLAGTGVANLTSSYKAGDINFNMLGVNEADFKDPLNNDKYKIGATTNVGGAFQLASKIENDDNGNTTTSGAFLVGNYSQRTAAKSTGLVSASTGSSSTEGTLTLASTQVGFYKTGDYVTYGSIGCTVLSVGSAQDKITVKCGSALTSTGTLGLGNVNTGVDEISSLIAGVNTGSGVANGSNPPY